MQLKAIFISLAQMKQELLALDKEWASGLLPSNEIYWQKRDSIAQQHGYVLSSTNVDEMEWEKEEWE